MDGGLEYSNGLKKAQRISSTQSRLQRGGGGGGGGSEAAAERVHLDERANHRAFQIFKLRLSVHCADCYIYVGLVKLPPLITNTQRVFYILS